MVSADGIGTVWNCYTQGQWCQIGSGPSFCLIQLLRACSSIRIGMIGVIVSRKIHISNKGVAFQAHIRSATCVQV